MRFLENLDGKPIVQFDLENGLTVSLLKRWEGEVCNVSMAYWPTNSIGAKLTVHVGSELSDDEAIKELTRIPAIKKGKLE